MAEPAKPYTLPQLADRWQCSRQHLFYLVKRGKIRAFTLGRLYRVSQDEVERIERCDESGSEANGLHTGATTDSRVESLSELRTRKKRIASLPSGSGPSNTPAS